MFLLALLQICFDFMFTLVKQSNHSSGISIRAWTNFVFGLSEGALVTIVSCSLLSAISTFGFILRIEVCFGWTDCLSALQCHLPTESELQSHPQSLRCSISEHPKLQICSPTSVVTIAVSSHLPQQKCSIVAFYYWLGGDTRAIFDFWRLKDPSAVIFYVRMRVQLRMADWGVTIVVIVKCFLRVEGAACAWEGCASQIRWSHTFQWHSVRHW